MGKVYPTPAYLTLGGESAQLRFREIPEVWLAVPGRLGVTVAGRHYAVFYQGQGQLDGTYLRLVVSPGALLSVAALPEASEALLKRFATYAFHRPINSRVDWRWLPDEGVVEVTFTLATQTPQGDAGGALMGLYPLHWKHTDTPLTGLYYQTPRGVMKLAETNHFTIRLPYTGLLPVLPLDEEAAPLLQELLAEYLERGNFFPLFFGQIRRPDSYADGKSFGRLAALLPIAEQLGETAAATTLLEAMKERLALWFTPDDGLPLFYYNANWGALIAAPTSHGLDQSLNDHAFHYGYFLQAAASIAERDPAWVADWGPMVELLIRNTAGPRDDPMFPFLRALDPYLGHGWASGSGLFGRGNNLESSSEAINFAAGLIRWAEAVGNEELLNLGIYLYATQTAAVWEYWFAAGGNFPPEFPHTAIGILWGDGGAYRTWWTLDREAIHGINFLPITGSSLYLGRDRNFVLSNYQHMTGGRERPHYWPDIALSYLALADPEAALALWSREIRPEFGDTRARTYHWLRSLARYGTPVAITADTAQFAVLSRGDSRTYLAFNPSDTPRTVHFSDGTVLLAAPNTLTIKELP